MLFHYLSVDSIVGSIIPFLVLDIVTVALRFRARKVLKQGVQIDDWFSLAGLLGVVAITSILFQGICRTTLGYPWGKEGYDLNHPKLTEGLKYEISSMIVFVATNGLIKLSVLFFYRRVFVIEKSFRDGRNVLFCIMIIIVVMWSATYTFVFIFSCGTHFELLVAASDENPADHCLDGQKLGCYYAIMDFISDAVIILTPLPFIARLRLPLYRKVGVMGVFMLGLLASAASLVRLIWMYWSYTEESEESQYDNELGITTGLYWLNLEITLGLLACCLPNLSGLLKAESIAKAMDSVRGFLSNGSRSTHVYETDSDTCQGPSKWGHSHVLPT